MTSPPSPIITSLAVVGLSVATFFGAFKLRQLWEHAVPHGWLARPAPDPAALAAAAAQTKEHEEALERLSRSLQETQTAVEEKAAAAAAQEREIEGLLTHARRVEEELDSVRTAHRALATGTVSLEAQKKHLALELQRAKTEQQQTAQLLETRTAELRGAEAFLTKADQLSNVEVVGLLESLNSEIMQIAASMTEELTIEEKRIDAEAKEQESDEAREAYARAEDTVGPRMAELLKNSEHHEDPILVQLAVQASMAAYTHWIISSWVFESPEDEHMLSEIYARVRETEEQAVSGRWRQLTRKHLQRMLAHDPDLSSDMLGAVANIFTTAGLKDSPEMLYERIVGRFAGRVSVVMKLAVDLNKHIGEGITSCDLEALYIAPDVKFNPATMDDAIGASSSSPEAAQEMILCTTDLGLVRAEKIASARGDWKESVLLKPKVVLYSGIASIIGDAESPL
ncbi:hypothetical protein BJ912DRAFT_906612 [Pholiota molesta]|nr:hypothetical protein BJ912DRAFT_906612 [Pholiota molesta]